MTRTLTAEQWFAKASRHVAWDAAWSAEMAELESIIDSTEDPSLLQKIIARLDGIDKRNERLKRVKARHLERAPDLLPGLERAAQTGRRVQ